MPVTKPPVAMLYSLSQAIHTQTRDRQANYAHAMPQGLNLPLTYLAGKLIQQQFLTVVDEDILDGTLAADHKAVVLTSLDYLDPPVVAALERFAAGGGLVLLTGDCSVAVRGAIKLPVTPRMPDQAQIDELSKAGRWGEMGPYTTTAKYFAGALPLARAIQAELAKAGIQPVFQCDASGIVATRQAAGDVEYLFAVNATPDDSDPKERIKPKAATATIKLPADGRPVYDAVRGGPAAEFTPQGGQLAGTLRFGAGQLRALARTARPIGGVRLAAPVVLRELVRDTAPLQVELAATVVDDRGGLLSGSIPLHVLVRDPLGATRHELYRATRLGLFSVCLPLAANDPPGRWTVTVRELLSGLAGQTTFDYQPPPAAGAIAGATPRAVFAPDDRANVFRFARLFHDVTIVKGKSPLYDAAARRLTEILAALGRALPRAGFGRSGQEPDDQRGRSPDLGGPGFRSRQAGPGQPARPRRLRRAGPGDPAGDAAGSSARRVPAAAEVPALHAAPDGFPRPRPRLRRLAARRRRQGTRVGDVNRLRRIRPGRGRGQLLRSGGRHRSADEVGVAGTPRDHRRYGRAGPSAGSPAGLDRPSSRIACCGW